MRGPYRESEPVETPPHRAEIGFSSLPCRPLPARGARKAVRRSRVDGGDLARRRNAIEPVEVNPETVLLRWTKSE
jgi:hypothetical protein